MNIITTHKTHIKSVFTPTIHTSGGLSVDCLCSSSFVSKVLGANCNRANDFHPVADKFAMCTGQEVTFEPTSNAHARVDYNTLTR